MTHLVRHEAEIVPELSMAIWICPVADSGTARPWPTELPGGGQEFCPKGGLGGQWCYPLAGGCLGESDAVAVGEHDVGVVE